MYREGGRARASERAREGTGARERERKSESERAKQRERVWCIPWSRTEYRAASAWATRGGWAGRKASRRRRFCGSWPACRRSASQRPRAPEWRVWIGGVNWIVRGCVKRSTDHIHTHRQRTTPPPPTHTHTTRKTPQTNTPHKHVTTNKHLITEYRVWMAGVNRTYMLNTRSEEQNTVLHSYLACVVNTVTLNIYGFPSYTGLTRRNTWFIFWWLPHRNTWSCIQHLGSRTCITGVNGRCKKRNRSHTQTHKRTTPHNTRHDDTHTRIHTRTQNEQRRNDR